MQGLFAGVSHSHVPEDYLHIKRRRRQVSTSPVCSVLPPWGPLWEGGLQKGRLLTGWYVRRPTLCILRDLLVLIAVACGNQDLGR